MGATQSKKRRKDIQKKKRGSISFDVMLPPRSASMDVLHSAGIATANPSASCPLCPHCRLAVSWSSDHTLTNSLCLHHAKMGHSFGGDTSDREMFESCPECLQVQTTTASKSSTPFSSSQPYHDHHPPHPHHPLHHNNRLCEISNQDYNEMSTMSLNRKMSGKSGGGDCNSNTKAGGIVQSKSVEFSDFSRGGSDSTGLGLHNNNQTKENVNPNFCRNGNGNDFEKQGIRMLGYLSDGDGSNLSTAKRQSTLTKMSMQQRNDNTNISTLSTTDSSSTVDNNNSNKETKSNLSLLDDEEMVMSRWVRRKQMAQELRNLRMHLQHEEDAKHQNDSNSSQNSSNKYKPYSLCNNNVSTKEKTTVNESFTSTTTQTVMEAGSVSDTKQQKEISHLTASKDSVCRNSSTNISDSTTITTTTTTSSATTDSTTSATTSPFRRSIRSKFSKLSNYRCLDNHPVMTRLQNEQNNRLELMERRMEEIRISAMQEAERRRFAEIFPAKDNDSETQKLLREARESLERMKEEKRKKVFSMNDQQYQHHYFNQFRASSAPPRSDLGSNSDSHEDVGEIIPVIHVLSSSRETSPVSNRNNKSQKKTAVSDKNNRNKKSIWSQGEWPDINLGKPLTWLWLPFMLFPLVLRMLLTMLFNLMATPTTPRNSNSVSNTGWSHPERSRNLPRDKRKKSC